MNEVVKPAATLKKLEESKKEKDKHWIMLIV